MKRTILLCTLFLALMQGTAWSQIPKTMSNQGVLKDASGALVTDGNYSLTFKLYDVAEGGTALWSETQSSVSVVNGVFSVILGSITTLDLNFDKQYWLGVKIESDTELSPRIQLTASPYSLNALSVAGSSNTFPSDGNVGIGTANPTDKLHVAGNIRLSGDQSSRITFETTTGNDHGAIEHVEATENEGQLRIAIGDDDGQAQDNIAFGVDNWGTNFVEKMRIQMDGRVGIGTTNPFSTLHIKGTDHTYLSIQSSGSGTQAGIEFFDYAGANPWDIMSHNDHLTPVDRLGFWASSTTEVFTLLQNGNVGIGTTNPAHLLEVYDGNISLGKRSDAASIRYVGIPGEDDVFSGTSAGGASIYFENTGGGSQAIGFKTHEVGSSYDTRMYIDKSGNVGIGTPNPQTQLHIADGQGTLPSLNDLTHLLIQDNDNINDWTGITVLGGSSGGGFIEFGDESSSYSGAVYYNHSSDHLGFTTTTTERMRITSSGDVGIGTTSPSSKVHATGDMRIEAEGPAFYYRNTVKTLPNGLWRTIIGGEDNFYIQKNTAAANDFSEGYNFTISNNGNVGIGTTNPGTKLEVEGASGDAVIVKIDQIGTDNWVGLNLERDDIEKWHIGMNNTDDYLRFRRTSSSDDMVIDGSGNVGIGTTSPNYPLDVNGQALISSSSFPPLRSVRTTTATSDYGAALSLRRKTTGDMTDGFGVLLGFELADNTESSSEIARIVALRSGADNKGTLTFETMGSAGISEAMRIDNSGNVGIGTTTPENKLHVELNTSGAEVVAAFRNAGTIGSTQARIQIQRGDDTGTGVTRGLTIFTTNGNSGLADYENRSLSFYTGSGANATEKMTITNAGNVGIGTTSPTGRLNVQGGGVVVGSPTGGDKGTGTVNAQELYDDGVTVSDYVFDSYFDGEVRDEDKELHGNYNMMSLDEVISFMERERHLPTIIGRKEWNEKGKSSLGKLVNQLWETVETQAIYIKELKEKIDALEQQKTDNSAANVDLDGTKAQLNELRGNVARLELILQQITAVREHDNEITGNKKLALAEN